MSCRLCAASVARRESVMFDAFKTLLEGLGKSRDFIFMTLRRTRVYPDGALLHELRVPLG